MKIENNKRIRTTFGEIKEGDCFIDWGNCFETSSIWMKLDDGHAARVTDGKYSEFVSCEHVLPVSAKVVIE